MVTNLRRLNAAYIKEAARFGLYKLILIRPFSLLSFERIF